MRGPVANEALAESLDGWLGTLGNKVRIRDFDGIGGAFTGDFAGESLFPVQEGAEASLPVGDRGDLPMEIVQLQADDVHEVLDRSAFLTRLEEFLSPWQRVSQSSWRLASSQFQYPGLNKTVEWGVATVRIHVVGHPATGGTLVLDAMATAVINNDGGEWRISRFRVDERRFLRQGKPMFSEVSRATGVAYDGLRFGEPGNDADGWNGAASADVDGDGLLDIFVPGARESFLYRADGDGGFAEEGELRGLSELDGGTGAAFFDYDRDGDQDLAVAFIGWRTLADEPAGRSIELYRNDGTGVFENVTYDSGLSSLRLPAYSMTAFDADGDGWTDLYVCGYGRMEDQVNDNWLEATNGASDLLLKNIEGRGFVDRTEEAGLVDRRWSYASAAADYDEDGDLDLYVGNNFGRSCLFENQGDGTFLDVAPELGVDVQGNVMGVLWTDVDGDGRLDLYLSSPTSTSGTRLLQDLELERGRDASRGMMQMANGNKLFLGRELSLQASVPADVPAEGSGAESAAKTRAGFINGEIGGTRAGWSWSAASPDIDLDGNRDIVCVNGFVTGEVSGDT